MDSQEEISWRLFTSPGVYAWEADLHTFSFSFSPFRGERGQIALAPKGAKRKKRGMIPRFPGVNAWASEKFIPEPKKYNQTQF
jgi:hypothetical protein